MRIHRIKNKIRMAVSGLVAVLLLVATVALRVIPGAMADSNFLQLSSATVVLDGVSDAKVQIGLSGAEEASWNAMELVWATSAADGGVTLSSFWSETTKLGGTINTNDVSTGNVIWWEGGDAGYKAVANEPVWAAEYTVSKDTPSGVYRVGLKFTGTYKIGDEEKEITGAEVDADIEVLRTEDIAKRTLEYENKTVAKEYGDGKFTNELKKVFVGDNEEIDYESSNTSVVTVDANGEATLVGLGSAIITARTTATEALPELTATYTVNVEKKKVALTDVQVEGKVYDGTLNAVVKDATLGSSGLKYGEGFTVEAKFDDANAGKNKPVTITAKLNEAVGAYYEVTGNYTTSANIEKLPLTKENAALKVSSAEYTGSEIKPEISVKVNLAGTETELVTSEGFGVTYPADTVNAGAKTVKVNGIGNYDGEFTLEYEVTPAKVTAEIASLEDVVYDGTAKIPGVGIYAMFDAKPVDLTKGVDYEVECDNNINAGTASIAIKSKSGSNFTFDNVDTTFRVLPYEIKASNVKLAYSEVKYDGTAKTPEVTVKVGDVTIASDQYTVTYGDNNTGNPEADTEVVVTVAAKDGANITGAAEVTFVVTSKDVLKISGIESQTVVYTGEGVKLAGELSVAENGYGVGATDLTTKWYAEDGMTEIEQPTNVGNYVVVYGYSGASCEGELRVTFAIEQADSTVPEEAKGDYKVAAGAKLSEIALKTTGLSWNNPDTVIMAGEHKYPATYVQNGDSTNYKALALEIPVYGLSVIDINTSVSGSGGAISESIVGVLEGTGITLVVTPDANHGVKAVLLNGVDVTSTLKDNKLLVTAGTEDVAVTASFRKVYSTIEADGKDYAENEDGTLSFRFDADYGLFETGGAVYVDGALITSADYTSKSGSTIITLSKAFVDSLGAGAHTLAVVFSDDGMATADFEIVSAEEAVGTPETGKSTAGVAGVIAGVSILPLIAAGVVFYKKYAYHKVKIDFDK